MRQPSQVEVILKKIWPTINRVLNAIFYFLFTVIRSTIKGIIDQVKGGI